MDIEKSRTLVNEYLERIFAARIEKADSIHERYRLLWDRIQRLSFHGGKRIRPYLTMVAYGQMDAKNNSNCCCAGARAYRYADPRRCYR